MMEKKSISKKKSIDLNSFVNVDTGESLSSELKEGSSVTVNEKTGLSEVYYSDYSVISTEAILALSQILNNSDLANVVKMSVTVKTALNVIFNNNIPHTNNSLQKYLQIKSESMFLALIKRLMKVGILYQMKGRVGKEIRVFYLLNPYICRKRRTFENKILTVFEQFKDDLKINKE